MKTKNRQKTEIIAISSGKGGTGKTLIAACLGYVLRHSDHGVLMIDADPGTNGLSLFLLGSQGIKQIKDFSSENMYTETLRNFDKNKKITVEPRQIHRKAKDDHGISYDALISGKGIFGDQRKSELTTLGPNLSQSRFREAANALFDELRSFDKYGFDYILVDTRGGFTFESTDLCALADSFIVVTEPDYTSLYQDRNLMKWIDKTASETKCNPLLRAIIVNKSTEGEEESFRLALEREFPIKYTETYPIPLDLDAMKAYKTAKIPYLTAPASHFSYATLNAFSEIMQIVTSRWEEVRIDKWNQLIETVSKAINIKNEQFKQNQIEQENRDRKLIELSKENKDLKKELLWLKGELKRVQESHEREFRRADEFRETLMKERLGKSGQAASEPLTKSNKIQKPVIRLGSNTIYLIKLLFIGIIIVTSGYFGTQWFFSQKDEENMLMKVYDTKTPPFLRTKYLLRLYENDQKTFTSINLSGLDLSNQNLDYINFNSANLQNAVLKSTSLRFANFKDANLRNADMRAADLTGADLIRADLRGAILFGAKIKKGALFEALIDSLTKLPDDIDELKMIQ